MTRHQRTLEPIETRDLPTRSQAVVFSLKVILLRLARGYKNLRGGPARHASIESPTELPFELEHRSRLFTTSEPTEVALTLGKIQNLRLAVRAFDGVYVPAGEVLSFWRQLGRVTRRRGYVLGREVRQGCIVPALGGGICQLSNALYDLALKANFEIVERHPHTRTVPNSDVPSGRDATVAWNHIDLRFRSQVAYRIEAHLTSGELIVRFRLAEKPPGEKGRSPLRLISETPGSCETCGEVGCFRHNTPSSRAARSGSSVEAFVIDVATPELKEYWRSRGGERSPLLVPIRGSRPGAPRHALTSDKALDAPIPALLRAIHARQKAAAPVRRAAQMADTERIARALGKKLPPEATRLEIDISLLGGLSSSGALGGRSFNVFATRWPLRLIHELLDEAAALFPQYGLLSDFRAPQSSVLAEWEALEQADSIVTPHVAMAEALDRHFPGRIQRVEWIFEAPKTPKPDRARALYFPGPTAAREGAMVVAEAARRLDFPVVVAGRRLETADLWEGVEVLDPATHKMEDCAVVVCHSVFKNRPTEALRALALGLPVIATPNCGLGKLAAEVTFGDLDGLCSTIATVT